MGPSFPDARATPKPKEGDFGLCLVRNRDLPGRSGAWQISGIRGSAESNSLLKQGHSFSPIRGLQPQGVIVEYLVRKRVTIRLGRTRHTGRLVYDGLEQALVLGTRKGELVLSVNLLNEGFFPTWGNAFIKDWSEHHGLTDRLEAPGLVKKVRQVTVGSFRSTAFEVRVL